MLPKPPFQRPFTTLSQHFKAFMQLPKPPFQRPFTT